VRDQGRLPEFLDLLREPATGFASGQWLAKKAGISRSAVWKQVRNLRRYGYTIESLHGNGAVVIAAQQSGGRGRMKRKWVSPKGGVWLSVVLKPSIPTAASTMLPFVAAVAVCDAIRDTTGVKAALKWPNDVMVGGKKVAGILLDLSAEAETVNYAVIGIGINANVEASKIKVDREGRPAITSLKEELGRDVNRLQLVAALLEKLEQHYAELERDPQSIINEWRTRSDMLGREVAVIQQGKEIRGIAADINDDGSLLVKTKEGDMSVVSGDVFVRY
jgi:BirA family biotin operon repressor/biotin-[acetyl-CoA-carboxylase] ligase